MTSKQVSKRLATDSSLLSKLDQRLGMFGGQSNALLRAIKIFAYHTNQIACCYSTLWRYGYSSQTANCSNFTNLKARQNFLRNVLTAKLPTHNVVHVLVL